MHHWYTYTTVIQNIGNVPPLCASSSAAPRCYGLSQTELQDNTNNISVYVPYSRCRLVGWRTIYLNECLSGGKKSR